MHGRVIRLCNCQCPRAQRAGLPYNVGNETTWDPATDGDTMGPFRTKHRYRPEFEPGTPAFKPTVFLQDAEKNYRWRPVKQPAECGVGGLLMLPELFLWKYSLFGTGERPGRNSVGRRMEVGTMELTTGPGPEYWAVPFQQLFWSFADLAPGMSEIDKREPPYDWDEDTERGFQQFLDMEGPNPRQSWTFPSPFVAYSGVVHQEILENLV
ncbi:hypothetical protein B0H17DRAFT_1126195 [Mycena rosella]|uniref:Uncharacterized protein n=1 Tax=Mycena rosella TaxID=1033263 RepID=A0AAD7GUE3_MYCRO|nr:hypothetical protein B0H17DRAFT_1126195 [Mycena rosella]